MEAFTFAITPSPISDFITSVAFTDIFWDNCCTVMVSANSTSRTISCVGALNSWVLFAFGTADARLDLRFSPRPSVLDEVSITSSSSRSSTSSTNSSSTRFFRFPCLAFFCWISSRSMSLRSRLSFLELVRSSFSLLLSPAFA